MKLLLCFISLFICNIAFCTPENVIFVFLSEESSVSILKSLETQNVFYAKTASLEFNENCIPMGDEGCFHPQLGYIEKKATMKSVIKKKKVKLKTFNSSAISLIDCKENNYFDIFCGKESKDVKAKNQIEIWIDTSASMRRMDYEKKLEFCQRHRFLNKIEKGCGKNKVGYKTFDTSIKEISEKSISCLNYGLNDTGRLIEWIKNSRVKQLYIITDIDELNAKLSNYIDSIGAKTHGVLSHKFLSTKLLDFSDKIIEHCLK